MSKPRWSIWIVTGAIIAIVAVFGVVNPGSDFIDGPTMRNLSNARNLGLAVRLFAENHDGRFPMNLAELVPDYLGGDWNTLLYRAPNRPHATGYDWLYFGAFHDQTHVPTILIASPQAFAEKGKLKRIVLYPDISCVALSEDRFHVELRQAIAKLNERAAALMPKQE